MSRLSKKDLVRDFESGGNRSRKRAENERAKARRRMLGMLCFCVSNRTETVGQGACVSGVMSKFAIKGKTLL